MDTRFRTASCTYKKFLIIDLNKNCITETGVALFSSHILFRVYYYSVIFKNCTALVTKISYIFFTIGMYRTVIKYDKTH